MDRTVVLTESSPLKNEARAKCLLESSDASVRWHPISIGEGSPAGVTKAASEWFAHNGAADFLIVDVHYPSKPYAGLEVVLEGILASNKSQFCRHVVVVTVYEDFGSFDEDRRRMHEIVAQRRLPVTGFVGANDPRKMEKYLRSLLGGTFYSQQYCPSAAEYQGSTMSKWIECGESFPLLRTEAGVGPQEWVHPDGPNWFEPIRTRIWSRVL